MPEGLLDRGERVLAEHPVLAAVPLLTGIASVGNVERVAGFHGVHVGFKLPVASPVLDVWSFVSVPQQGVTGPTAVPLLALPAFVLLRAVLAAGYLGCIDDALAGADPSFVDGVRRYVVSLAGFQLLSLAGVLALVAPATVSPVLLVLVLPALLVAAYLFYGAPYLVVAADEPLADALGHSARLATDGGRYAAFFGGFVLAGGVLSVVATAVVVNLGVVGVLLGVPGAAPLAVVLNGAAMALFRDLDGVGTDPAGAAENRPAEAP